jgi:ATP-dependent Clp protease ATP-binding subunit ClpB
MTSNLASSLIQDMAKESYGTMKTAVMGVLQKEFRPEFINRIDEVVVFHPLQKNQMQAIANIQLNALRERLQQRELTLALTEEALTYLIDLGYDPIYGARPLKRVIQQYVENPLAQAILSGTFLPRDVINITKSEQGLVFAKA